MTTVETPLIAQLQLKNLYLDLMKRCLMNLIYDNDANLETGDYVTNPDTGKLIPQSGKAYSAEEKLTGVIWPSVAHTMIGWHRLTNLQNCVEDILQNNIPGDFIETGVWRGGASIFVRSILKAYGVTDRTVWVADSFEGLPPTQESTYESDHKFDWLSKVEVLAVSLDQVKANFSKYGLLDHQVQFLKGWFCDTLPTAPITRLALLRLDGDLYESTIDALNALYPKLSVGGYVIVDDYHALDACRMAVQDYRQTHIIHDPIHEIDGSGVFWQRTQ